MLCNRDKKSGAITCCPVRFLYNSSMILLDFFCTHQLHQFCFFHDCTQRLIDFLSALFSMMRKVACEVVALEM